MLMQHNKFRDYMYQVVLEWCGEAPTWHCHVAIQFQEIVQF
jgi:hypothetical protein